MLAVMITPTGIGAEIGGHSGDATAAAALLAATCDRLIVHPNVVNASDLSEQPRNSLYVEGSMLDLFLAGDIRLQERVRNRILVVCNEAGKKTINCVNAYRSILGINAAILELRESLTMRGWVEADRATGSFEGHEQLIDQVQDHGRSSPFDVLAVHTPIDVDKEVADHYVEDGGINPWGGVEAMVSRLLSDQLGKPVAHAPLETAEPEYGISDPRLAPEMICGSHLGCVLKGLHRAPLPSSDGFSVRDVSALITPLCWGPPHIAARAAGLPIIFVTENRTEQLQYYLGRPDPHLDIIAANYLEAAGVLVAIRHGFSLESLRRPLDMARIYREPPAKASQEAQP